MLCSRDVQVVAVAVVVGLVVVAAAAAAVYRSHDILCLFVVFYVLRCVHIEICSGTVIDYVERLLIVSRLLSN